MKKNDLNILNKRIRSVIHLIYPIMYLYNYDQNDKNKINNKCQEPSLIEWCLFDYFLLQWG